VGCPNTGKTTIFNRLTHARYKTVNYPGSTVDVACGVIKAAPEITLVDSPGVYSLLPKSEEEQITFNLLKNPTYFSKYRQTAKALIVSVVDMTQPARHLVLTRSLIQSGFKVVMVLTMADLAAKQGYDLNLDILQQELGCPVLKVNGRTKEGLENLIQIIQSEVKEARAACFFTGAQESELVKAYSWADELVLRAKCGNPYKEKFDLDQILFHPIWGGIIFIVLMGLFFYSIFCLAPRCRPKH